MPFNNNNNNNKKYDFSGKVALVTGSSSGIGAAIALQLAQYGARVTITGQNAENLAKYSKQIEHVSGGVKPLQIVGNLVDDSMPAKLISETVAKFGRLDFLVNNAGTVSPNGRLSSSNLLAEFDQVLRLNVRTVVELTQLAVPHLEKTQGNVINISSIASVTPFYLSYCASKAALDMVTKTCALELGPKGIRVNSINPGPVMTPLGRSMGVGDAHALEKIWESMRPDMLLKLVGEPSDIANLASFIASDDARNITGSIYFSDGGALIKPIDLDLAAVYQRLNNSSK